MMRWDYLPAMVVIILFIYLTPSIAQTSISAQREQRKKSLSSDSTILIGTRLSLSYLGSILYPGVSTGIEMPKKSIEIHKLRKRGEKIIYKERYYSVNLGMYHHKGFHTNLFLTGSYNRKRISKTGYFIGYSVGLGISRSFLAGTTYTVDDSGNVGIERLAGNYYFSIITGLELGKDFYYAKQKRPIQVFCKPGILLLMPYSSNIYPRPLVEIGVKYRMNNLLIHTAKHIYKTN